eukprot:scaffold1535_cov382-Prasinococcus_capsulatus_cf.AAC.59
MLSRRWEQMVAMRREALTQEITAYKRKALEFKQAGQQEEARTALRHFKGLQAELDRMLAPLPNSRGDNTAAAVAPHTAPVGSEAATARSLAATTTETPAAADAHSSWNVEQLTNQVADFKSRAVAAKQAGRMVSRRSVSMCVAPAIAASCVPPTKLISFNDTPSCAPGGGARPAAPVEDPAGTARCSPKGRIRAHFAGRPR